MQNNHSFRKDNPITRHYQFQFYINAAHQIRLNGTFGEAHPHTWELSLLLEKRQKEFVKFEQLEQQIEELLAPYQDVLLNDLPPFHEINPTLENFCEHLRLQMEPLLEALKWNLLHIKLSETPVRSYIIELHT